MVVIPPYTSIRYIECTSVTVLVEQSNFVQVLYVDGKSNFIVFLSHC